MMLEPQLTPENATDSPQANHAESMLRQSSPMLLLAGFPKCATTSMAQWLDQSPAIAVTNPKETFLLCPEFNQPPAVEPGTTLADCFSGPPVPWRMEASTLNVYSEYLLQQIAETDDVKVILMFRDPVAAVFSWHNQVLQADDAYDPEFAPSWQHALRMEQDADAVPNDPRRALKQNYANICRFGSHISRWLDALGHERVLVVDSEELKGDCASLRSRLDAFLGCELKLPDQPLVLNSYASIRFSGLYKRLKRSRLNQRLRDLERRFSLFGAMRRNLKERLFRRKSVKQTDGSLESELRRYFQQDVGLVQRRYQENRDQWSTPQPPRLSQ